MNECKDHEYDKHDHKEKKEHCDDHKGKEEHHKEHEHCD
ncbi:MAG TPA: zinc ABC transporter substrate-binding protein, partial [Clostridium sp.]|nr:zinc ABC transporter substrate-binding protein [Clostridium sp.]